MSNLQSALIRRDAMSAEEAADTIFAIRRRILDGEDPEEILTNNSDSNPIIFSIFSKTAAAQIQHISEYTQENSIHNNSQRRRGADTSNTQILKGISHDHKRTEHSGTRRHRRNAHSRFPYRPVTP